MANMMCFKNSTTFGKIASLIGLSCILSMVINQFAPVDLRDKINVVLCVVLIYVIFFRKC